MYCRCHDGTNSVNRRINDEKTYWVILKKMHPFFLPFGISLTNSIKLAHYQPQTVYIANGVKSSLEKAPKHPDRPQVVHYSSKVSMPKGIRLN